MVCGDGERFGATSVCVRRLCVFVVFFEVVDKARVVCVSILADAMKTHRQVCELFSVYYFVTDKLLELKQGTYNNNNNKNKWNVI